MTTTVNTNNIPGYSASLNDYTNTITVNGNTASGGTYIASGAAGSLYNWGATGTSALDWSNISVTASPMSTISSSGQLYLSGENADIKVNGRSLMSAINALEQRLNILVPNPKLEAEWDELRELGERYRALEQQCKEKGEMWNKLKTVPPSRK